MHTGLGLTLDPGWDRDSRLFFEDNHEIIESWGGATTCRRGLEGHETRVQREAGNAERVTSGHQGRLLVLAPRVMCSVSLSCKRVTNSPFLLKLSLRVSVTQIRSCFVKIAGDELCI